MVNPLKKLMDLFGRGGKSVIGVDIGSSSIKIVQLRRKGGKAILETYGELALGPYAGLEIGRATNLPADKLGAVLTDLIRESNVTTRLAGMSIPTGSSLVSLIELPALDERQLAQIIPLEARKYIPVPVSEVALDWWVIPREEGQSAYIEQAPGGGGVQKGKMVDVLLVAILNDVLAKYRDIVNRAALDCSFFEIEIFSTIRAVLEQDIAPVLIFDMGAASTKLSIVERGIVRGSHTVNRGSQDITLAISRALNLAVAEAEKLKRTIGLNASGDERIVNEVSVSVLQFVFAEANRFLQGFQRKYNKSVSKVVLTGGGSTLKGLEPLAKSSFSTPVSIADPFERILAPAFLEKVLKEVGPEFSVALGLALRRIHEVE